MKLFSMLRAISLSLLLSLAAFGAKAQSLQATAFSSITGPSSNSTLVTGAGQTLLKWIVATNTGANTNYLRLYNKATAPTCGTDVPIIRIPLLPTSATSSNGQFVMAFDDTRFTLGIGFCVTKGTGADNDATAADAGLFINLGYFNQ